MRLENLCEMQLGLRGLTLIRPYGGEQGAAYVDIDGAITGEKLSGTFHGVNHPRRRSDGAMLPDAHGVIQTHDGAAVLFSMAGRTVWVETPSGRQRRQLLQ